MIMRFKILGSEESKRRAQKNVADWQNQKEKDEKKAQAEVKAKSTKPDAPAGYGVRGGSSEYPSIARKYSLKVNEVNEKQASVQILKDGQPITTTVVSEGRETIHFDGIAKISITAAFGWNQKAALCLKVSNIKEKN